MMPYRKQRTVCQQSNENEWSDPHQALALQNLPRIFGLLGLCHDKLSSLDYHGNRCICRLVLFVEIFGLPSQRAFFG